MPGVIHNPLYSEEDSTMDPVFPKTLPTPNVVLSSCSGGIDNPALDLSDGELQTESESASQKLKVLKDELRRISCMAERNRLNSEKTNSLPSQKDFSKSWENIDRYLKEKGCDADPETPSRKPFFRRKWFSCTMYVLLLMLAMGSILAIAYYHAVISPGRRIHGEIRTDTVAVPDAMPRSHYHDNTVSESAKTTPLSLVDSESEDGDYLTNIFEHDPAQAAVYTDDNIIIPISTTEIKGNSSVGTTESEVQVADDVSSERTIQKDYADEAANDSAAVDDSVLDVDDALTENETMVRDTWFPWTVQSNDTTEYLDVWMAPFNGTTEVRNDTMTKKSSVLLNTTYFPADEAPGVMEFNTDQTDVATSATELVTEAVQNITTVRNVIVVMPTFQSTASMKMQDSAIAYQNVTGDIVAEVQVATKTQLPLVPPGPIRQVQMSFEGSTQDQMAEELRLPSVGNATTIPEGQRGFNPLLYLLSLPGPMQFPRRLGRGNHRNRTVI